MKRQESKNCLNILDSSNDITVGFSEMPEPEIFETDCKANKIHCAKSQAVELKRKIADEIRKENQKLFGLVKQKHEQQLTTTKQTIRKIQLSRLRAKQNRFDVMLKNMLSADEVKFIRRKIQKTRIEVL